MLPKQVYNYNGAPEGSKFVDDNWISGWLRYNKVKIPEHLVSKQVILVSSYWDP